MARFRELLLAGGTGNSSVGSLILVFQVSRFLVPCHWIPPRKQLLPIRIFRNYFRLETQVSGCRNAF